MLLIGVIVSLSLFFKFCVIVIIVITANNYNTTSLTIINLYETFKKVVKKEKMMFKKRPF